MYDFKTACGREFCFHSFPQNQRNLHRIWKEIRDKSVVEKLLQREDKSSLQRFVKGGL